MSGGAIAGPRLLLAVSFLYFAASVLFRGALPDLTQVLLGIGSDPESFVWYLAWWPWAVGHGHDPFWSRLVFAPVGYSMAWGTSVPTASLFALPVTLLGGPVLAYNLLVLTAPALAGCAMFALAHDVTADRAASFLAGFLFGFSGYENGQILGHLNLALIAAIPLAVLLAVRRGRGRLSRFRFVTLLALVLLAQFGVSTELFATTVVLGGGTMALLLLLGAGDTRRSAVRLGAECAASLILVVVFASPMLLSMARGAADIPAFLNPPITYSNDLLNLFIPTEAERFPLAPGLAAQFSGNAEEQDLYLGLPLLLILVLFALERRIPRTWRVSLAAILAGLVLASLGPWLHVLGKVYSVPLPWIVATYLPLLRGALPCRIGLLVSLVASLAAALWLAAAPHRRRPGRFLLGALAVVFLLPGVVRGAASPVIRPCLFTHEAVERALGPAATILLLPYGSGDAMLWQALSGMAFAQAGGLLSFVPLSFQREPAILPLLRNQPEPNLAADLVALAARHGVRFILAGPGTGTALGQALRDTHWPAREVCGVDIVTVPGDVAR